MFILGIWDGHDSGAAIINDNKVLIALNEERLTRRKLEVAFPEKSIFACLEYLNLSPEDISVIAISSFDFSKTLNRIFPSLKEEYYQLRRRKKNPGKLAVFKKMSKCKLTEIGPNRFTKYISRIVTKRKLIKLGFKDTDIRFFDHHLCHSAAAAFCSGFEKCAVITIDGIGDALSGSISVLNNRELKLISTISGKSSLGIFFEYVTNLLNLRELEDEGKVMALANYACPIKDDENPLIDFFQVEGVDIKAKYGSLRMFKELKKILWRYPSEQFAYLAQRVLETKIIELVRNVLGKVGHNNIALSGGVFSNIKVNMHLRTIPEVTNCFVFPHMGDGGLALGAALCANYELNNVVSYELNDIFWGLDYKDKEIEEIFHKLNLVYEKKDDVAQEVARLIVDGEIVFWFQGRMEYGPRSLGHRSILALPDSEEIKNQLNLKLKMRSWYQPFCPSILEEDAKKILESDPFAPNRFMTMAYLVKPEYRAKLKGVTNIDGTCRPQMVNAYDGIFYQLLLEIKKLTGIGAVLNTSFNIHGDFLVCSPEDAVDTFLKTGNKYMAIHNYIVKKGD